MLVLFVYVFHYSGQLVNVLVMAQSSLTILLPKFVENDGYVYFNTVQKLYTAVRIDALDQWCLRRILGFKWLHFVRNEDVRHATQQPPLSSIVKTRRLSLFGHIARMNESTDAIAVSSSNHRQRSGRNLADGHAIPGSGLLLTTWQAPTLGFRKQERQLRRMFTGGCLRSIAQRTRSGACSYWIGYCQAY